MSNVKKLHNKKLYRVELNITSKYVVYLEANSYKDLDREVSSVVNSDMYTLATDQKPEVISYDYSSKYITCEESFEDFINGNNNLDRSGG